MKWNKLEQKGQTYTHADICLLRSTNQFQPIKISITINSTNILSCAVKQSSFQSNLSQATLIHAIFCYSLDYSLDLSRIIQSRKIH